MLLVGQYQWGKISIKPFLEKCVTEFCKGTKEA